MTRRILLACLLLLACGLGFTVWILASEGREATGVRSRHHEESTRPTAAAPELARLTEPAERAVEDEHLATGERSLVSRTTIRSFDVLVLDERGRPIAGAEVLCTRVVRARAEESARVNLGAFGSDEEDFREPVFTNERGRCTFSAPGDTAVFHVRAEGYCHTSQNTDELTVMLGPAVTISGRVLEAGTGLPIPGAEVRPLDKECVHCAPRATTADGLGRYSMPRFPRGRRVGLAVRADGYLPAKEPFKLHDLNATTLDVVLQPSAEVWLEFFDVESGVPVERVYLSGAHKQRSDAQGRVRVQDLVPAGDGHTRVKARGKGYAEARITVEAQHLNALQPLRIPMVALRPLSGRVIDTHGVPLEDARVKAKDVTAADAEQLWRDARRAIFDQGPRKLRYKVKTPFTTRSDREGLYEFTRLPPWCDELEFSVEREGYLGTTGRRTVSSGTSAPGHEWVLTPGFEQTGEIRGQLSLNGIPTTGRVWWSGAFRRGTDTTDEEGFFTLEEVELGSVRLTADHWDLDTDDLECAALLPASWTATVMQGQSTTVDINLAVPVAIIAGHVRYRDGEPVADVDVQLISQGECAALLATTDANGWWSRGVPAGIPSWDVTAWGEHDEALRLGVRPGATNVDLVLERSGRQRLRVIDRETNMPITEFELRWWHSDPAAHIPGRSSYDELELGLPDPAGWFEFELPGGLLDLAVSTRDQDRNAQPAFAFGVNTHRGQPLELVVLPGHRVDLKLRKGEEPWPRDVDVFLLAQHERGAIELNEAEDDIYDGDISTGHSAISTRRLKFHGRRASLTGLPPGRYTFVSYPNTIRFHPPTVRAGPGTELVLVRWERR